MITTLCPSANYNDLYQWSVDNYSEFWGQVWRFCGVVSSKPYEEVSPTLPVMMQLNSNF